MAKTIWNRELHPVVTLLLLGAFLLFFSCIYVPPTRGFVVARQSATVMQSHEIGVALLQYAGDHGGKYPTGASSTEVFQKLLDENYVSDPVIFYIAMPGKVKPVSGEKLKSENVSWDVTSGADDKSDGFVPLVFYTGYKITYAAGTDAVPLTKPFPSVGYSSDQSLIEQIFGVHPHWNNQGGLAVTYAANNSLFVVSDSTKGVVPNFVPPNFHPDGHTYVQLTPTGPLKP